MVSQTAERYCAEQARRFDYDRYFASLLSPAEARPRVWALLAFGVEIGRVREAVSEPLIGEMRLQWWRDTVDGIYRGTVRDTPVARALAGAIADAALDRAAIERMIDARGFDLDDEPPEDMAALERYAAETGGDLAALCAAALGASGDGAARAARDVGTAWALVGLVRAVPHHARAGRVFLPRLALRQAGVQAMAVSAPASRQGVASVARQIAERAGALVREARQQRAEVPKSALPALLPALLIERYVARLARVQFDPFAGRVEIPRAALQFHILFGALRGAY